MLVKILRFIFTLIPYAKQENAWISSLTYDFAFMVEWFHIKNASLYVQEKIAPFANDTNPE